jgi:multiple sugar transport system permease protein
MSRRVQRSAPLRIVILAFCALAGLAPVAWMLLTSVKLPADTAALPPRLLPGASAPENSLWFRFTLDNFRHVLADSETMVHFLNSLAVSTISAAAAVVLGAAAAYGFSRFPIRGGRGLLLLALAARLLPPLALAVPLSFLYSRLGLLDTRFGLILLYTCLNLAFSIWLMKAFLDEIPAACEEAAMLDGYTRPEAVRRVVLPQARTGLIATAVFCFLAAWNEYAFALTLTGTDAVTMPVRIHAIAGNLGILPWGHMAAASVLFLLPTVILGLLMRKHLLRAVTYGMVKR